MTMMPVTTKAQVVAYGERSLDEIEAQRERCKLKERACASALRIHLIKRGLASFDSIICAQVQPEL